MPLDPKTYEAIGEAAQLHHRREEEVQDAGREEDHRHDDQQTVAAQEKVRCERDKRNRAQGAGKTGAGGAGQQQRVGSRVEFLDSSPTRAKQP